MIETLTVVTLCVLYLVYFRPGKTPPLENQLVIERPGIYKITFAPKLNIAQPFIEAVIDRIIKLSASAQHGSAVQYFAVTDKQVTKNKSNVYLLAVVMREGMLYLFAEHPFSGDPGCYFETIKTFANDLLTDFPAGDKRSKALEENIVVAIREVSQERGITVELLPK